MELNVTLSERLEGLMLEARRAKTRTIRRGGFKKEPLTPLTRQAIWGSTVFE